MVGEFGTVVPVVFCGKRNVRIDRKSNALRCLSEANGRQGEFLALIVGLKEITKF